MLISTFWTHILRARCFWTLTFVRISTPRPSPHPFGLWMSLIESLGSPLCCPLDGSCAGFALQMLPGCSLEYRSMGRHHTGPHRWILSQLKQSKEAGVRLCEAGSLCLPHCCVWTPGFWFWMWGAWLSILWPRNNWEKMNRLKNPQLFSNPKQLEGQRTTCWPRVWRARWIQGVIAHNHSDSSVEMASGTPSLGKKTLVCIWWISGGSVQTTLRVRNPVVGNGVQRCEIYLPEVDQIPYHGGWGWGTTGLPARRREKGPLRSSVLNKACPGEKLIPQSLDLLGVIRASLPWGGTVTIHSPLSYPIPPKKGKALDALVKLTAHGPGFKRLSPCHRTDTCLPSHLA